MAHHQFIIYAASTQKARRDDLDARIRHANPSNPPLVRTVKSFDGLRAELAKNRDCDWFFLIGEWQGGALRLGAETHTLTALASAWKGVPKLRVIEVMRFCGPVTGRKPTGMRTFSHLVGDLSASSVEAEWGTHSNFPPPVL